MMNAKRLVWAGLLSLAVAVTPQAFSAEHAHEHGSHGSLSLELNQGEKWKTDAPLRKGMETIRSEMAGHLGQIHSDSLAGAEYLTLANKVQGQVQYMFANCELPPSADAQLHILLARMLEGVEQMRSESGQRQGAVQVVQALGAYGDHFEHSGWQGLHH